MLGIAFDSISAARVERLAGFGAAYIISVDGAVAASAQLVDDNEYNMIHSVFSGGTGQLAESVMLSPTAIGLTIGGTAIRDVETDEPYAWRMERGFFGTDSLGRRYSDMPHPYAQPAIDQTRPEAFALYEAAIIAAWEGIL